MYMVGIAVGLDRRARAKGGLSLSWYEAELQLREILRRIDLELIIIGPPLLHGSRRPNAPGVCLGMPRGCRGPRNG